MTENELFEKALTFAVDAHAGQIRKGNKRPFIVHPLAVMTTALEFKPDTKNPYLIGAGSLLHDTVEDTEAELEDIAEFFGYKVAAIVQELTTDKEECARLTKKVYLAKKMINMSSYGLFIKLVDRLVNLRDMRGMSEAHIARTVRDTLYIIERLQTERKLTKTHQAVIKAILKECKKLS